MSPGLNIIGHAMLSECGSACNSCIQMRNTCQEPLEISQHLEPPSIVVPSYKNPTPSVFSTFFSQSLIYRGDSCWADFTVCRNKPCFNSTNNLGWWSLLLFSGINRGTVADSTVPAHWPAAFPEFRLLLDIHGGCSIPMSPQIAPCSHVQQWWSRGSSSTGGLGC